MNKKEVEEVVFHLNSDLEDLKRQRRILLKQVDELETEIIGIKEALLKEKDKMQKLDDLEYCTDYLDL